ncbi:MAG: DUF1080 domain-containing protein [Planctomycetaceae bacterium]|nr:DUF1080 domain-containing protein [Planctomycetaceae bacterium]
MLISLARIEELMRTLLLTGWICLMGVVAARPALAEEDTDAGFKPIFDGETLAGWKGEEGFWSVEDGAIVGESTDEKPLSHNTFLLWDQGEVDDFELRLKFRISGSDAANSGIQFRGSVRPDGHVIGYQADIDRAGNWVGALYDEAQRGVLATRGQKTVVSESGEKTPEQVADPAELFKNIHIDDWNEYSITARDNHITLKINGDVTAEIIDNDPNGLDRIGKLALQLHSGPPMKIEFKDIHLKRFPLKNGWKKAVFVAGSPSHGYFSHEHNAGCLLLAEKLNTASKEQGLPIIATVYTNGWPKDPTAFDNADTVVSYCDGGGRHYLNSNLDLFDRLVEERGVGLACIHYAVETVTGEPGDHFLKWMGGFFEPHWSVNPHWTAKFDDLPDHAITNGVESFEINDEWYYHMRFVPEMKGVTPILTDMPPRETLNRPDGAHSGNPHVREAVLERKEPQHVAWAYERPEDQGRGFGFTGGHFHKNWGDDNFRKLVLNAICWTANLEVPEQGVVSATPTQEELEANQDEPKPSDKQAAKPQTPKPVLSEKGGKPVYSSPTVSSKTPGHAVDIEADITGAKSLFLVVTDAGDGFSCDWADWAEPRLIAGETEKKLTELKWSAADSQWGNVQVNKNAGGKELKIAGKRAEYGIGTHANSVIEFALPADHKFTKFQARGGIDNGGTDQGCGSTVQFHVFTERPSKTFLAKNTTGDGPIAASHESIDALEQLDVHPELEADLFASEPMMTNPASIDIDHLGRVWVCEAINYRAFRNADVIGDRKEGDRILILEDTDGDAKADKSTVFYQGHDVDSAHGILVLPTIDGKGTRALISALDKVFFLVDEDGDLKADKHDVLFTGIDGAQHDHGIHAFHFGPDGKLYFNFGNAGKRIKDRDGNPIVDRMGNEVNDSRKPYQEGMVFRCNLDGSEFETLGWNFRNNWEVCVDSFGTMWQSDNDDDGNRGVRINYVMDYGNYGYRDELTGAGWKEPRTNLEKEVPLQHWHLNDPGVVPNLLQTGAGAPTGICIYEGDLMPMIKGAPIHTDAGTNICRAYVPKPDGAGYTAETINLLDGARNKWFRPSDVCVAPDGSLLVADWYDPGVGGHRMQDVGHGRIFRIRPKGKAETYSAPEVLVSTVDGAMNALRSPNMATRYMAWTALQVMGEKATPSLQQVAENDKDPVQRARAEWLLMKLGNTAQQAMMTALKPGSVERQIIALRALRQTDFPGTVLPQGIEDSPALRRELYIMLYNKSGNAADNIWTRLAKHLNPQDRWELEALGIGARWHWDSRLAAWLKEVGDDWNTPAGRAIIWRSRASQTPALLAKIIQNPNTPQDEIPRYLRAFDFLTGESKTEAITELAFAPLENSELTAFVNAEAMNRLGNFDINSKPEYKAALAKVLESNQGTEQFVKLVSQFSLDEKYPELLKLAQQNPNSQLGVESLKVLFDKKQQGLIRKVLEGGEREPIEQTLAALTTASDGRANGMLLDLINDEETELWIRRGAIKAAAASLPGAQQLLKMAQDNAYSEQLKQSLAAALTTAQWRVIVEPASKLFPPPPGKSTKPLPSIPEMSSRSGNVAQGRIVFNTTGTCNKCHRVNGIGTGIGPDLSEIGKKLAKPALYESILYPSAAISHGFENWLFLTLDGQVYAGLIASETAGEIKLKDEKGILRTIGVPSIDVRKKQEVSLMPNDIQKLMTEEELVDLVEYLTTLKEKRK